MGWYDTDPMRRRQWSSPYAPWHVNLVTTYHFLLSARGVYFHYSLVRVGDAAFKSQALLIDLSTFGFPLDVASASQ